MVLKSLKLSGWRSFAPDLPAEMNELGVVNLLIGPNNVGKSNIGRFLVRLRDILDKNGSRHIKPWHPDESCSWSLRISFATDEIDSWLREAAPIEAEISIDVDVLRLPYCLPAMFVSNNSVRFQIQMSNTGDKGSLTIVPLTVNGLPAVTNNGGTVKLILEDGSYTDQIVSGGNFYKGLGSAACHYLVESLIEIMPLRDPTRKSTKQLEKTTDGGDIIEVLQTKQQDKNQQKFWTKYVNDLEMWFAILLDEQYVRIEINDGVFWITIKRGEHNLRLALSDLGAGVSEILIMLAYMRLHHEKNFLVLLDEPEAHLHPGAVVELARIITTKMPNHQLLITTHSTALIDAITPDWRTFRVSRSPQHNNGTAIEVLDTTRTELELLADLGIRPSQLFLARVVLWVEGPSDVHYWTALLRKADNKLIVGRDFAFVTYGGASSSHLDFNEDEGDEAIDNLVQVLKISHRAVIICDRDRPTAGDDRALVTRLISAASKLPQHARVETSIGREIENSVKSDILLSVLQEVRPKRLNKPDSIQLTYTNYSIGKDDSFDDVVANAARTIDGSVLTTEQIRKIKQRLEQKKNLIASRINQIGLDKDVFQNDASQKVDILIKWLRQDPFAME